MVTNYDEIIGSLFLGEPLTAEDADVLRAAGVTTADLVDLGIEGVVL